MPSHRLTSQPASFSYIVSIAPLANPYLRPIIIYTVSNGGRVPLIERWGANWPAFGRSTGLPIASLQLTPQAIAQMYSCDSASLHGRAVATTQYDTRIRHARSQIWIDWIPIRLNTDLSKMSQAGGHRGMLIDKRDSVGHSLLTTVLWVQLSAHVIW